MTEAVMNGPPVGPPVTRPVLHLTVMLFVERHGDRGPLLILLHWLGGSGRTWREVSEHVAASGFRCVAVDMPGFGRSAGDAELALDETVLAVTETIVELRQGGQDRPWLIAGHSMGGKVAAMIARASESGEAGLEHLRGVVLVSPSPPGPEPMQESKREEMLRALGPETVDGGKRRANAEKFVDDNTGRLPLHDDVRSRAVEDVLRMNPQALLGWLTAGSKDDRSKYVGRLSTPALVLAGTEEKALGPKVQTEHTAPHFAEAEVVELEGGGHLGPLERPREVGDRMVEFFGRLGLESLMGPSLGRGFSELIASERTSPQTRAVMLRRMDSTPKKPRTLSPEEMRTLRALAARVIPGAGFDLAARYEQELADSEGDGWRFSHLPDDREACRLALASLDAATLREYGVPFVALDVERQDALLRRMKDGDLREGLLASLHLTGDPQPLNAAQMRDWFDDLRGGMVRVYVADPRAMERMGFTGFADEGGFTEIKLGAGS